MEQDKEVRTTETNSDAGGGTRRSHGHWGTLDNVIEQRPRGNTWPLISAPRAKAAPRRTFVLRSQPSNISMSNRRTSITGGNCRLRRVPRPATGHSSHLDLQRNWCALLTERSHINRDRKEPHDPSLPHHRAYGSRTRRFVALNACASGPGRNQLRQTQFAEETRWQCQR
jgi:hypothetical protein